MANIPISELPVLLNANAHSGDSIPIVDSVAGETKRITIGQLDIRYQGVPNGGTTNQILSKASATDKDVYWRTMAKNDVGLGLVDNTSDVNKPISNATQAALNLKANITALTAKADVSYVNTQIATKQDKLPNGNDGEVLTLVGGVPAWAPGGSGGGLVVSVFGRSGAVTAQAGDYDKTMIGLDQVDNTSDADKPISNLTQTALNTKQDSLGTGAEGQALRWVGGIPTWAAPSPLTTKGDLYGYSTTIARVPVGSNGQLLTADSAAATGVSWQNAPITLPSQTGQNGKFLTTNGSAASWAEAVSPTGTQVLTNKDYDGGTASNTSRLTVPKDTKANLDILTPKEANLAYGIDTKKLYVNDGTNWSPVGSGGGTQNFISNPDGSLGTTGWSLQTYSAATRPSGTPTAGATQLTFAATTTNPLNGTTSFLLTKAAGTAQGQAAQAEFDLNLESRAKVLALKLNYLVNSGTFSAGSNTTDSDVIVYTSFYDGSTWSVAEPSSFKLLSNSSSISDVFSGSVQSPYNATKMRLILYVASTSSSAYALKLDASVAPSTYVYGTPITDWQSYTPTLSGAPGTTSGRYRRVGDSVEVKIAAALTGAATTTIRVTYPTDAQPDAAKLPNGATNYFTYGTVTLYDASANIIYLGSPYIATGAFQIYGQGTSTWGSAVPIAYANGDYIQYEVTYPVLGWSSSVQMSDSYDGRVIDFVGYIGSATALTANVTNLPLTTVKDATGSWTGSTYIIRSPGDYEFTAIFEHSSAQNYGIFVYVNGASRARLVTLRTNDVATGSTTIPDLKAGDIVSFRSSATFTTAISSVSYWTIKKIQGPTTMAALPKLVVDAFNTNGQPIATSTDVALTNWTKVIDTTGAFNPTTGIFTAQNADILTVNFRALLAAPVANTGYFQVLIRHMRNGSSIRTANALSPIGTATYIGAIAFGEFEVIAGDTIIFLVSHNNGVTKSMHTSGSYTSITIRN